RITDVGQVPNDRLAAQMRLFDFDECADFHAAVKDCAVTEMRIRTNLASSANPDDASDRREGINDGASTNRGTAMDIGISGVNDRDTFRHPMVLDACLHDCADYRQVLVRIDSEDVVSTKYVHRNNFAPHAHESLRHVSEVVFSLGIAGVDLIERI